MPTEIGRRGLVPVGAPYEYRTPAGDLVSTHQPYRTGTIERRPKQPPSLDRSNFHDVVKFNGGGQEARSRPNGSSVAGIRTHPVAPPARSQPDEPISSCRRLKRAVTSLPNRATSSALSHRWRVETDRATSVSAAFASAAHSTIRTGSDSRGVKAPRLSPPTADPTLSPARVRTPLAPSCEPP